MIESVLRNYEGRGFTQEEIAELSQESGPVNDRGMQSVKKLVKKMPDTIFDIFDDESWVGDLPF